MIWRIVLLLCAIATVVFGQVPHMVFWDADLDVDAYAER